MIIKSKLTTLIIGIALATLIGAGAWGLFLKNDEVPNATKVSSTTSTESSTTTDPNTDRSSSTESTATAPSTKDLLVYLVEEEKLAHDVYDVLYEKWGANVFGNIKSSESTHQSRVLSLLESRDIADPRPQEAGTFNNLELQDLYNQLVEKGLKSAQDAYEVGVIIEEKDIKDINTQLATATDDDVISTLEDLRRGSENHLRAFNRQLDRQAR